jgi:hypothetical protein
VLALLDTVKDYNEPKLKTKRHTRKENKNITRMNAYRGKNFGNG